MSSDVPRSIAEGETAISALTIPPGALTSPMSTKKKAFKRLRKRGQAKIGLTADDGYGDVTNQALKVKLIRKSVPTPG